MSRARNRGYTVVEVLSAMTLFAIGAAGVIGMQRVTIQGGMDARNFDIATNIAREWQHRLQRDAMIHWTEPNSLITASNRDIKTAWLKDAVIGAGWKVPAAQPALEGNGTEFDLLGRELMPGDPNRVFCVQYRLSWIASDMAAAGLTSAVLRSEVRVFWSRLEFGPPDCANTTAEALSSQLHFVYVSSAIRGNPLQ